MFVVGTRSFAPTAQWLSRRHGRWLPTATVPTLEAAATTSGGRSVTARPAELLVRPPLVGHPAGLPLADRSDGERLARVAVAELPRGRVLGPHRAIITGNGALVDEVSRYFGTRRPREHPLFLNPFPGEPLEVDGRLGVLAARGDGNYYHFLMDSLTRLGVLAQAPSVIAPERWYVPQQARFQRELLDLVGVDVDQRVDAGAHPHVRAETLLVPGPPAMTEQNPPWAVEFLRARLLPAVDTSGPRRRLFITRGPSANNRSVVNEAEVLALLEARGFQALDPGELPVTEQIRAFATASVILAPHGAALTNLIFCSPGARVIELFPAGCLLPDYWRLACGVPGLTYRYLSAWGGPARPTRGATIVRDIEVDLPALTATLDALG